MYFVINVICKYQLLELKHSLLPVYYNLLFLSFSIYKFDSSSNNLQLQGGRTFIFISSFLEKTMKHYYFSLGYVLECLTCVGHSNTLTFVGDTY